MYITTIWLLGKLGEEDRVPTHCTQDEDVGVTPSGGRASIGEDGGREGSEGRVSIHMH